MGGGGWGARVKCSSQHSVSGLVLTSPVDGWMSPALGPNTDKGMSFHLVGRPAPKSICLDRQRSARIMDLYDAGKTPGMELVGAYPVWEAGKKLGGNHRRGN